MRWENKGHEYDDVYRQMEAKRGFYLFGCGDYGRQFWTAFRMRCPSLAVLTTVL